MKRLPQSSIQLSPLLALLLVLGLAAAAAYQSFISRSTDFASTENAAPGDQQFVRAAHWFGGAWPVNFWNTRLEERAANDFAALRSDGFNTVVFVVPWSGFAPDSRRGTLDGDRVTRLLRLIRTASDHDLHVILRLGYTWDAGAADSHLRQFQVWTDPQVHAAWLDHLGALWDAVGLEPNLTFGFLSWEDLWAVASLGEADLQTRIAAAGSTGFREWLQTRLALAEVSERWGSTFDSWDDVPLPTRRSPAFKLLYEFMDRAWIDRFFAPAQQRFPRLSMEIRVDADPIWDGERLIEWHGHESAWDLPGAEWTTLYWSPAMGGLNQGETISPKEASARLAAMLARVQLHTGARHIFVGQFLAEDFTPGHEMNGRVARDSLAAFLRLAASPLQEYAGGYGLWAWTDYSHDAIANPEFASGLSGWSAPGAVVKDGWLELPAAAVLATDIHAGDYHVATPATTADLCIHGASASNTEAQVLLSIGGWQLDTLTLPARESRVCVPAAVNAATAIRLQFDRAVRISRITSSAFVQNSGMRDTQGRPKQSHAAWLELNSTLHSTRQVRSAAYEDGWIGRSFIADLPVPPGGATGELRFRTHLPPDWPVTPTLTIAVDGAYIGSVPCAANATVRVPVAAHARGDSATIRIDAATIHQPLGDRRALGCVLLDLVIVPVDSANAAH
jgi:hypothetical protein